MLVQLGLIAIENTLFIRECISFSIVSTNDDMGIVVLIPLFDQNRTLNVKGATRPGIS